MYKGVKKKEENSYTFKSCPYIWDVNISEMHCNSKLQVSLTEMFGNQVQVCGKQINIKILSSKGLGT